MQCYNHLEYLSNSLITYEMVISEVRLKIGSRSVKDTKKKDLILALVVFFFLANLRKYEYSYSYYR
jgi:hypothetical protein